jgi:hypothetical protein
MKRLVHVMKTMPMVCPGESDIVNHFIKNAKHEVKVYLTEHTPAKYWKSADQFFDAAVQYATNLVGSKQPNHQRSTTIEAKRLWECTPSTIKARKKT